MVDTIRDLLDGKAQALHTVASSDPVSLAVRKMSVLKIGALPVIERGALVGIFSERDVLIRIVDKGLDPDTTPVSEVMTPHPTLVPSTMEVDEAMRMMSKGHFRHLPVVDRGHLIGMVSMGDSTARVIRNQQSQLESMVGATKMSLGRRPAG